jgi:hypothetical protein
MRTTNALYKTRIIIYYFIIAFFFLIQNFSVINVRLFLRHCPVEFLFTVGILEDSLF